MLRAATDAWWAGLAGHLRVAGVAGAPDRLTRPTPAWTDPALLFSQTCGYPLTHALAGRVTPLLTPAYAAPGCRGSDYSSAVVVAADNPAARLADLRGAVCAINGRDSHSGCNVLRYLFAPLAQGRALFARVVESGSHVASIQAIVRGEADLCAVDAVTHALLARHTPQALAGTRVLQYSPSAPGLPWIAGPAVTAVECARLRTGVRAALADPALAETRAALLLEDAVERPAADYERIRMMEREAAAHGYPRLQ